EKALSDAGRGPESMVQSVALVAAVGQDEAELAKRAAAIGREPAELRKHGIAGTVAEVADRLKTLEAAGIQRVYLQILDLADLDHLDLIAREVRTQLG
ncbi:LLM class F420-dependent oxidoreductase, partial [Streptomyces griseoincarnatus]